VRKLGKGRTRTKVGSQESEGEGTWYTRETEGSREVDASTSEKSKELILVGRNEKKRTLEKEDQKKFSSSNVTDENALDPEKGQGRATSSRFNSKEERCRNIRDKIKRTGESRTWDRKKSQTIERRNESSRKNGRDW